jgi:hypothetical protein
MNLDFHIVSKYCQVLTLLVVVFRQMKPSLFHCQKPKKANGDLSKRAGECFLEFEVLCLELVAIEYLYMIVKIPR